MDISKQQARIDAITWYHEFDFGNGLKARTKVAAAESHRQIWRSVEQNLDAIDFQGKSVLDIGCWDGYWSFYAERRGARSVLATDDCTQNWMGSAGCLLAKELLGSSVSVNLNLSVYELTSLHQQFDIILFLGVYYHLFDPFYALAQIRHCCHSDTLVLIEGPVALAAEKNTEEILESCNDQEFITQAFIKYLKREPDKGGFDFYLAKLKTGEMTRESVLEAVQNSEERKKLEERKKMLMPATVLFNFADHACEWLPTMGALEQLLHATYFSIISPEVPDICPPQPSSTLHRRLFLKCAPFVGTNELHLYRPPFGLHRYDSRFCEASD